MNSVTAHLENLLEVDLQQILKLKPAQIKKMTFTDEQARGLVRLYYRIQKFRTATFNQTRAFKKDDRPHTLVHFFGEQMEGLEKMCGLALDAYSAQKEIGKWARSNFGIGPVISAGLIANIDITKAPVVSHIWRYAGLDPTIEWLGAEKARKLFEEVIGARGKASESQILDLAIRLNRNPELFLPMMLETKKMDEESGIITTKPSTRQDQINTLAIRPWNSDLKMLCWKIGESFLKFHKNDECFYGKIYLVRKAYEKAKNEAGEYAAEAAKKLAKCNIVDKETRATYESGKLPDGHIESRVKRYAVKIFLSHYHAVAYELHYNEKPPKPFAISILNHAHEIPIPNWPMV
jgi:hypothetical protein